MHNDPAAGPGYLVREPDGPIFLLPDLPVGALAFVGRGPACDVQVGGVGIDRRHVWLERTATGWVMRPDETTTGTWMGDRRVRECTPLRPGDRFRMGDGEAAVVLRYRR